MRKIRLTSKRISILTNILSTLDSHIQSVEMTLGNKKYIEEMGNDSAYVLELKAELPNIHHASDVIRVYINRYAGFEKGSRMYIHNWLDETEVSESDFELAYNSISTYYNFIINSGVLQKDHKKELRDQLKLLRELR